MTRREQLNQASKLLRRAQQHRASLKRKVTKYANYQSAKTRTSSRGSRNLQNRKRRSSGARNSTPQAPVSAGQQEQDSGGEGLGESGLDVEAGRLGNQQPSLSGFSGRNIVYQRGVGQPAKIVGYKRIKQYGQLGGTTGGWHYKYVDVPVYEDQPPKTETKKI